MTHDAINPEHYRGKIEPLDAIEAWAPSWPPGIAHHLACAVKYAARCARKGDMIGDLIKARQYLDRAIDLVGAAPEPPPEPCRCWTPGEYDDGGRSACPRHRHEPAPAPARSWDLPPVTGMTPPAPVRTPPAWVLPFVSRPGHYAHAEGRTVGPKDSAGAALELLASALGWGAGERHAFQEYEVPAHA